MPLASSRLRSPVGRSSGSGAEIASRATSEPRYARSSPWSRSAHVLCGVVVSSLGAGVRTLAEASIAVDRRLVEQPAEPVWCSDDLQRPWVALPVIPDALHVDEADRPARVLRNLGARDLDRRHFQHLDAVAIESLAATDSDAVRELRAR